MHLDEVVEQHRLLLLGHPDPTVPHGDLEPGARPVGDPRRPDPDGAALGELAAVGEQVEQDLTQPQRVRPDLAEIAGRHHLEPVPVPFGQSPGSGRNLLDQVRERRRLEVQFETPGFDLGKIEHVVDQAEEVPAGPVDPAERLAQVGVAPLLRVLLEHFGDADDGVQGGPQFVAHRRKGIGFGAARRLCLVPRLAQRRLGSLEAGQVEIGEHPAAVRQRHDPVLEDPPVGQPPLARRDLALPDLGDPGGRVGFEGIVRDVVDPDRAAELDHLAEARMGAQGRGVETGEPNEGPIEKPNPERRVQDQDAVVDRVEHDLPLAQCLLLDLARGRPEHGERVDHLADLVRSAALRQLAPQVALGDRPHARAERQEPLREAAVNEQPGEGYEDEDGEAADRDRRLHRTIVNARFAVDSVLQVQPQADDEAAERLIERDQCPVGPDRPLEQGVEVGSSARERRFGTVELRRDRDEGSFARRDESPLRGPHRRRRADEAEVRRELVAQPRAPAGTALEVGGVADLGRGQLLDRLPEEADPFGSHETRLDHPLARADEGHGLLLLADEAGHDSDLEDEQPRRHRHRQEQLVAQAHRAAVPGLRCAPLLETGRRSPEPRHRHRRAPPRHSPDR